MVAKLPPYTFEGVGYCVGLSAASNTIEITKIPLGDGKLSTTVPQVGYVYSCTLPSSSNAFTRSNRISADGTTWDATAKIAVQGAVQWASNFVTSLANGTFNISGNGLPAHNTGMATEAKERCH